MNIHKFSNQPTCWRRLIPGHVRYFLVSCHSRFVVTALWNKLNCVKFALAMVQIRCCDILMKSRRSVIQALIANAIAIIIITVMPLEAHSQYTSQSSLIQNKKVFINGTGIGGVGTTFNKVVLLFF